MLGYVHYRKQSPPPAPGVATPIGIFATTIGTVKFRLGWQNFKYSLFSPLIISVVFLQCLSTEEKTTEITIFPFKMIEVIKSLYSKFCHLNRDVRAPAPPCTLLFSL